MSRATYDIARFFWQRVALNRSYVIGGNTDDEGFFPVTEFAKHPGSASAETCNTYNMLKLTRHLFQLAPSVEAMDFYERALFNHILPSQDPATGTMMYYCPLKPGAFKTFSTPDDSFWCCVTPGIPAFVGEMKDVVPSIKPVATRPLAFTTSGPGRASTVTLLPFNQMFDTRHTVYWNVYSRAEWETRKTEAAATEARRKTVESSTIDTVDVNVPASETNHGFKGAQSRTGEIEGRTFR